MDFLPREGKLSRSVCLVTIKFAGLRLTPLCADQIRAYADRKGLSLGAAIAEVLHQWLVKDRRPGTQ